jgi:SAM-dependent methyltransferase
MREAHSSNSPNAQKKVLLPQNIFSMLINKEKWPFKAESLDCIFNNLYLHTNENLENILKQYNKSLIKDGFLVSNLISNNSFQELKFCLNLAENERDGGVSLNSMPIPTMESVGNLVGRIGYNLPSITMNKSRLLFSGMDQIFEFLTQIGETNILKNKRKTKSQNCFIAAMALYKHLFNSQREKENYDVDLIDNRILRYDLRSKEELDLGNFNSNNNLKKKINSNFNNKNFDDKNFDDKNDGNKNSVKNKNIENKDLIQELNNSENKNINFEKDEIEKLNKIYSEHVYMTLEIASLICWRYHESQQKPKERGSAEFSLKDLAVEVLEKDLGDEIRFGRIEMKEGKSDEFEIIDITDKIKKKIIATVDAKILKEKGIIDEKGEVKIKDEEVNKKNKK